MIFLTATAVVLVSSEIAVAAAGDLDGTFAGDGVARLDSVPTPTAVAVGGDGRVVVTGLPAGGEETQGIVARLAADGTPDESFGLNGSAAFEIGAVGPGPTDIVVDSQGRTVIVGGDPNGTFVIRLTPDGQPDPSFGVNGRVEGIDPFGFAYAVALSPSDQLLLAAVDRQSQVDPPSFGVARLRDDGSLDPTFGSGGVALAPVGNEGGSFGGGDLDVASDGSIVFGSRKLARLTPDGQLDFSFGEGGVSAWEANFHSRIRSIVRTDNRIIVGYESCQVTGPSAGCSPAITTLDQAGSLPGSKSSTIGTNFIAADAQSLFAAGPKGGSLPATMGVRLVSEELASQRDFGVQGVARVYSGIRPVDAVAIATTPAGEPVVLGYLQNGSSVVARIELAPGPDDADADGFVDKRDRCMFGYAAKSHGCRSIERHLKLTAAASRVRVRVGSPTDACVRDTRVSLFVRNGDSTRRLQTTTLHKGRTATFTVAGRDHYFAVAAANYTGLARCRRAQT